MKNDLMSEDEIIDILIWLKDKIVSATDIEGETFYVEELIEVLFVYIKSIYAELQEECKFETIVAHIEQYAAYKAKEHIGLSSRIIFKYMDMLDIVKKHR